MIFRKTTLEGRSNLDLAIAISVLAMAALNLVVFFDQFGSTTAYAAASPCYCQVELA